ncbi:hypothetical protein SteCoe_25341 [Stentor coeruleus]|uniref:Uncharacterized protein n=1 Tax=Stentor coeruleus TaxID=5963 RepID=A0A1R2BFD8_9CILI|nr:hypothetical protein SteCoe_25341 [Stentor coeruleus]
MVDLENTIESFKSQGNLAFKKRDYSTALSLYTQGISMFPNSQVLYLNRALVYLSEHKYLESLSDSSKAIELDNKNAKAYYRKACALQELGELESALSVLNQCRQLIPDSKNIEEITNLKEEITKELEKGVYLPASHPERKKFNDLIRWLVDGGAIFPKIHIEFYSQDSRGVHCIRTINKKECILYIPPTHIITLELAQSSPIGQKMLANNLKLLSPKHCYLSTFIIQEKRKPDSFWAPYIKILPEYFRNFPIFFTEEEKECLIGTAFIDLVNEKIVDIKEDYNTICSVAPEFAEVSFEEFCRVRMAVSSRIFGMEIEKKSTDGFVPLADMLNHQKARQTSWKFCQQRNGFIIEAAVDIFKGQEVLDSYGIKCNSRFLLNYGFTLDDNDANEFPYLIKITEDLPFYEEKLDFLKARSHAFRMLKDTSKPCFQEMFTYMRLIEVDDLDFLNQVIDEFLDNDFFIQGKYLNAFSLDIEKKILQRLEKMSIEYLQRYPNSLEEDEEALKNEVIQNKKNCIVMRMGEKLILNYYLKMAQEILAVVDLPSAFIDLGKISPPYRSYVVSSLIPLKNRPR